MSKFNPSTRSIDFGNSRETIIREGNLSPFQYKQEVLGSGKTGELAFWKENGTLGSLPRSSVGGSSSGSGFTLLAATGDVDSSNVTFTFTQKPTYIVSDAAWYRENKGWTWSGSTATMTIPPNDDIYGFV